MIRYPCRCRNRETPRLGRVGLFDSPTTAIVFALLNRSVISWSVIMRCTSLFFYSIIKMQQAAKMRDFCVGKCSIRARLQCAEIQKSDLYPLQLLHQPAEVFKHDSDLILTAFDELYFVPWVDALANKLQSGGSRLAAVHGNTAAKFLFLLG